MDTQRAVDHDLASITYEHLRGRPPKLEKRDIQAVIEETGTPAGWYPLITTYDRLPAIPDSLKLPSFPQMLFDYLINHRRVNPDNKELAQIKANLRILYEAGPGAKDLEQEENNEASKDEDEITTGAHIPIPAETFLEELSIKMQLHPITIYWLLEELRAEGVRCKPEEQRLLEDRLSVLVLRLLGHRWPKQIEANEPIPAWAEQNGIIPLVNGTGKIMLVERLQGAVTRRGWGYRCPADRGSSRGTDRSEPRRVATM